MYLSWLIQNILISISLRASANRITSSLLVRNIRLNNASIFQYAIYGNIEGIRRLFDSRLATPNDI